METEAFSQLTQDYMINNFNPKTPDIKDVKYYSYGASLEPTRWSVFAVSHAIVKQQEGINDGLVRYVLDPSASVAGHYLVFQQRILESMG